MIGAVFITTNHDRVSALTTGKASVVVVEQVGMDKIIFSDGEMKNTFKGTEMDAIA